MEHVTGWVAPEGGLIRVAARQGGVVEAVQAVEGESVAAGVPLASLRLSSDVTAGDTGQAMANGLVAEGAANRAQARAATAKLKAQGEEMIARRAVLRQELSETRTRVELLEKRQALSEAEVSRGETLLTRGFLSKSSMDQLRSTALATAQDASTARTTTLDLERQIRDLDHEIAVVPTDVANLQAQAAQASATLAQKRVTTQAQSTFVATAPIGGRIVAVPVERGQTVAAGAAVAVLTPSGAALTAELYVPSRAAGFIRLGQDVRIQYQAFPYQTFGSARGVVKSVSRTVLAPNEVAIPGLTVSEPVFRVRVALPRQSVSAYGREVPLQPGMLLAADIVIDRRTLLEWLLDPLYAVGRRA
jgi:membrane fusion protein